MSCSRPGARRGPERRLRQGRRLFDLLAAEHIELERTRILEGEDGVTYMHYRVQR